MTTSSRLAAVLFADVVGYSDLSARDESRALALVRVFQRTARASVERFGGRVVKFLGDGVLAEFSSTRAAIGAAAALRDAFERETDAGEEPGASLRSGIHVGDVVASEGDILGDGVNTASRLHAAGLAYAALGRTNEAFAAFERVSDWDSPSTEIARYYFADALGPLRADARYRRLVGEIDAAWGLEAGN